MRIGHGYDVHAFGPGDHVTLGGVRDAARPRRRRAFGRRRDAARALRCVARRDGAGRHRPAFPGQRSALEGRRQPRCSCATARNCCASTAGGVVNADLTVLAERPRLGGHRGAMRANIAGRLRTAVERINIKATTCEGLGAIGRGEGLACHAVVLLKRLDGSA